MDTKGRGGIRCPGDGPWRVAVTALDTKCCPSLCAIVGLWGKWGGDAWLVVAPGWNELTKGTRHQTISRQFWTRPQTQDFL